MEPPTQIHPWPVTIPSRRLGQLRAKPVEYTSVNPAVVVEPDADVHFWGLTSRLGDYRGGRTSVMPVSFKLPASGAGE